jgi:hypothetical protein
MSLITMDLLVTPHVCGVGLGIVAPIRKPSGATRQGE